MGATVSPHDDGAAASTASRTPPDPDEPGGDDIVYERLDYAATLAKLRDLVGREVLVEARVGGRRGLFRLAARGVLVGPPAGQPELTDRRADGDDIEAFMLDTGGFLAVKEEGFVEGRWHAGDDERQFSAQPRLNVAFTDSVLYVAVLWRQEGATARAR